MDESGVHDQSKRWELYRCWHTDVQRTLGARGGSTLPSKERELTVAGDAEGRGKGDQTKQEEEKRERIMQRKYDEM